MLTSADLPVDLILLVMAVGAAIGITLGLWLANRPHKPSKFRWTHKKEM